MQYFPKGILSSLAHDLAKLLSQSLILTKHIIKFQGDQGKKKIRESRRTPTDTSTEREKYLDMRPSDNRKDFFLLTGMGSHEFRCKFCQSVSQVTQLCVPSFHGKSDSSPSAGHHTANHEQRLRLSATQQQILSFFCVRVCSLYRYPIWDNA